MGTGSYSRLVVSYLGLLWFLFRAYRKPQIGSERGAQMETKSSTNEACKLHTGVEEPPPRRFS
eukprot:4051429-Amphidinium_carterae.1